MRRPKCPVCKHSIAASGRGRRPIYCSRACRQKAYRKRFAEPPHLRLLRNDLFQIRDRAARARGAVAVLEGLGYAVSLGRRDVAPAQRQRPAPRLRVVRSEKAASRKDASPP